MQREPSRRIPPPDRGSASAGLGALATRVADGALAVIRGVVGVVLGLAVSLTVAMFAAALWVAGLIFAAVFRRRLRKAMERAASGERPGMGGAEDSPGSEAGGGGWRRFEGPGGFVGFYSVGMGSPSSRGGSDRANPDGAFPDDSGPRGRGSEAIEVLDVEAEVLDPPRRSGG